MHVVNLESRGTTTCDAQLPSRSSDRQLLACTSSFDRLDDDTHHGLVKKTAKF
jgi:hypothetical protein